MSDRPTTRRSGQRTSLTAILGVVMVPAAALVAVALVGPTSPGETVESTTSNPVTAMEAAVTTAADIVVEPVTSTDEDLVAACTTDGMVLVELEASGEITELQAAALAALRQLCEEAGIPLQGPPAPPPVVRTVKVSKPSGGSGGGGGGGDDAEEPGDEGPGDDDSSSSLASQYEAAHAAATSAIARAEEENPNSEKLREAYIKLAEAERKAASGNYGEAISNANEATKKAQEALREDD